MIDIFEDIKNDLDEFFIKIYTTKEKSEINEENVNTTR